MREIKEKTVFVCQNCGYTAYKWLGRCPDCGSWNSLLEERSVSAASIRNFEGTKDKPRSISQIEAQDKTRILSGIQEFDRVLGGGIVLGSVVLVGGDPGIGKSTLLLQISDKLSQKGTKTLYISGEESVQQTKLRADRLGTASSSLFITNETNLDFIIEHIRSVKPEVVVLDSIQVVYKTGLSSVTGSVSQVRECAGELTYLAKKEGISLFLVGHVTKEGVIAGPRALEHLVDTVLYFESQSHTNFRLLRAAKNRFGSTNEVAIFEMTDKGLKEVSNPSQILLSERPKGASGSVVVPVFEGTRTLLVEVQALVAPVSSGLPRRRAIGIDFNRTNLLIAVLERKTGLNLSAHDVYVSVAGGVKVEEPAVDLGLAIAIASSLKDIPLNYQDVAFGELGLAGEVRAVNQAESRIAEAKRLGFNRCLLPKGNLKNIRSNNMELIGVESIMDAVKKSLERR